MGIGPSTKETTLHHFRDPLTEMISGDTDLDLAGIIFSGTSQDNDEKVFSADRIGTWASAFDAEGAIVSMDGWGNQDIDMAETLRALEERGIPAVGLKFTGKQAVPVVNNKYMDTMVDFNKSKQGIETQIVGENTIQKIDAEKAVALLKLKMRKTRRRDNSD